ncbi:hypothetical protein [Amycolatopsis sp. H20-H5]|uniref:hypothetical protein n=1 Tax=Amycolatopsis sp. H20-H5 TaxID=3046309 RepID=UPI003FA3C868
MRRCVLRRCVLRRCVLRRCVLRRCVRRGLWTASAQGVGRQGSGLRTGARGVLTGTR